jgi:hypothetical protein
MLSRKLMRSRPIRQRARTSGYSPRITTLQADHGKSILQPSLNNACPPLLPKRRRRFGLVCDAPLGLKE